jgi:uncharacterized C2H2 Zn-finger protein
MRQQRIVIESWCDICEAETEGERVPSTSDIEFAFDGMRYAVDLCDTHKDPAWSAMLQYATEVGPVRKMGRPRKSDSGERINAARGKFPCPKCDQTFYTKQALAAHATAHTTYPAAKLQCPYCEFIAKAPQGLVPHVRSKHAQLAIDGELDPA